jgi:cytochrome P450
MLSGMRPLVIQHDPVARQLNSVPTLLPFHFDVTRTNVDHVPFGKVSPHLCLGSPLAPMKIRLMFIELIPRPVSTEPQRRRHPRVQQLGQRHQKFQ